MKFQNALENARLLTAILSVILFISLCLNFFFRSRSHECTQQNENLFTA